MTGDRVRTFRGIFTLVALTWFGVTTAPAAPPTLHATPHWQSPVRAAPDDLLFLPGSGFQPGAVVVYASVRDTTVALSPPRAVPTVNTPSSGVAGTVKFHAYALTVRLPQAITPRQSYALWVRNPGDPTWSAPLLINDARPLWFSPGEAFQQARVGGLPRVLKIVGRNLDPAPTALGGRSRVRLVRLDGPGQKVVMTADDDGDPTTALEHYVARVTLPSALRTGEYRVEVSRDGVGWVAVPGRTLTVRADPPALPVFDVAGYGAECGTACAPDDGIDDACCVYEAVQDAAAAAGGEVRFGPGRWELQLVPGVTGVQAAAHGILLPAGVSLSGAGCAGTDCATTVVRTAAWSTVPGLSGCDVGGDPCVRAVFTLHGDHAITGIHWDDELPNDLEWPNEPFDPFGGLRTNYFQLGRDPWWNQDGVPLIDNVTFTNNFFSNMQVAIADRCHPLRRIYVHDNVINAYRDGVALGGCRNRPELYFNLEDSVINDNTFYPSDYFNPPWQGAIASHLGAAVRVDFSGNLADGRADLPGTPNEDCSQTPHGCGWRAAFFLHQNNTVEQMLFSGNTAYCTGDKAGDGEALALDHNHYTTQTGFAEVWQSVIGADDDSVVVDIDWFDACEGFGGSCSWDPATYFTGSGYWLQVVDGKGVGQVRRISSYEDLGDGTWRIGIDPAWDVRPDAFSKVSANRQYWQFYAVDNTVDIRGCEKDNPTISKSGVMIVLGNTADSALEGNRQYDSNGIWLSASMRNDPNVKRAHLQYFNEVRDNLVDGEYNFEDCSAGPCLRACCDGHFGIQCDGHVYPNCAPGDGYYNDEDCTCADDACCDETACCGPVYSWSGIQLGYGADLDLNLNTIAYGNVVSHNVVDNADALRGGGIAVQEGTIVPPSTPDEEQWRSTLIHHNTVRNIERLDENGVCRPHEKFRLGGGAGIHVEETYTHDTVLYANEITDVCHPIVDNGADTIYVADCPAESECGKSCRASEGCFFVQTGLDACIQPDDTVFACDDDEVLTVRRCLCSGPICALNDNHLVCLPRCPQEIECAVGEGCSATNDCHQVDLGAEACVRDDGSLFNCSGQGNAFVDRCFCSGPICALNDNHLVCR